MLWKCVQAGVKEKPVETLRQPDWAGWVTESPAHVHGAVGTLIDA